MGGGVEEEEPYLFSPKTRVGGGKGRQEGQGVM